MPSYYTKNENFASESPKCSLCSHFLFRGGIYRAVRELHRLGEVGLVPSGGRPAKPRARPAGWSGLHRLSPPHVGEALASQDEKWTDIMRR
jgi:hypothetical protein